MKFHKRFWLRRIRYTWKKIRRRKLELCLITCVIFLVLSLYNCILTQNYKSACAQIDVVYTWVNGSDPNFINLALQFNPTYEVARFDDKNELRYSLRSLERYAPWIRHVYIVTNGQIPYWLDLSNQQITVVPHDVLTPNPEFLPTFSSPAIETFLHRIPKLSQRFLYMNDDVFLGAPLYSEDLYTESEGVRIYQAWSVPDCAEDCPWTYIGDGSCDRHCNIPECQFDGGDCLESDNAINENKGRQEMLEYETDEKSSRTQIHNVYIKKNNITTKRTEFRYFPKRKSIRDHRHNSNFRDIVQSKNISSLKELNQIVNHYNNNKKKKSSQIDATSTIFPQLITHLPKENISKDAFSQSLIYTNMLLNRVYGFKPRNTLAHVGFLFDREIIEDMQTKFANEIYKTSQNRFRTEEDLQYAFMYYSFISNEMNIFPVHKIFDEFDTDESGTWSDREIRSFLARTFPLPLDWSAVRFFEEVINNCTRDLEYNKYKSLAVEYSTVAYERYEDSNLPTITKELVGKCLLLSEALESNFGSRSKYRFTNLRRGLYNNFIMLTSNISDVVDALDRIRRNPKKFNCINDNLDPHNDDNLFIRHLLEDFYISLFPKRSKFELPADYRNRYTNWNDYQRWRRRKRAALVVAYLASAIIIGYLMKFVCMHKAKFVRRYIQKI